MMRIPEAEIERLKAEVSVQRLAEARGIQLQRRGPDLVGLCPFHEDHEPASIQKAQDAHRESEVGLDRFMICIETQQGHPLS